MYINNYDYCTCRRCPCCGKIIPNTYNYGGGMGVSTGGCSTQLLNQGEIQCR